MRVDYNTQIDVSLYTYVATCPNITLRELSLTGILLKYRF